MILLALKTLGLIAGVSGALLVASDRDRPRLAGFLIWIAGNAAWVSVGYLTGDPFTGGLFAFYLLTAILGASNVRRRLRASSHTSTGEAGAYGL